MRALLNKTNSVVSHQDSDTAKLDFTISDDIEKRTMHIETESLGHDLTMNIISDLKNGVMKTTNLKS